MPDETIGCKDDFVEVRGGRVFVRVWTPVGGETGKSVILLHHSLGCVDLWRDFPAKMAGKLGRPVIAYDRLGFGRSSVRSKLPSANFIREEAETFFPEICRGLGVEEFALFGHSVGGAMALAIASLPNARCEAAVTESAQAFVEERTLAGIRAAAEKFAAPAQFEKLKRLHGEKAQWVLNAWKDVWASPEFADWTLANDLPNIRCPVLAIHGDQDEFGSTAFPEMIDRLSGGPSEMAILHGCGHVPHKEQPAEVLNVVETFLYSHVRVESI